MNDTDKILLILFLLAAYAFVCCAGGIWFVALGKSKRKCRSHIHCALCGVCNWHWVAKQPCSANVSAANGEHFWVDRAIK